MSDEHEEAAQMAAHDLLAMERDYPEVFAPYRMAIRIAALEAQVARLTAEPDQAEIEAAWDALDLPDVPDEFDIRAALTAFLERRMRP